MDAKLTHEQILDASSNGVIATDSSGNIIFINRKAKTILESSRGMTVGGHITDLLPMSGPMVRNCLETGEHQLGHHILDENLNLMVNITPIWQNGQTMGAVCSFQKMQQFEFLAQKLKSYRRLNIQWETIFKSSSDGIWVCDGKGKVININEASEQLNGIKAKDVIGKNVGHLVESGVFDRSVTLDVLETKRQVSIVQYVSKTKKYLLVTATPSFDEDGHIVLVVTNERDMTQLNAVREELDQARMFTEKFKEKLAELSMMELEQQEIIAKSENVKQVLRACLKLAHLGASDILILGESGTGKGLLAKFIHKNSKRANKPFVQINCAALPETLLEAELFGYEKGAFTGAKKEGKVGLFELADEGTLFLDEIGDLPFSVQAKLLKYLDDHEVLRLGGTRPREVDCKVIAATNRDPETLVAKKRFRQDLLYRLNTFTIRIPPLRERPEDVFELSSYFLRKYNNAYGLDKRISSPGLKALQSHAFPGNVRQLKSIIKKAVVLSDKDVLDRFIMSNLEIEKDKFEDKSIGEEHGFALTEQIFAAEREILAKAMTRCRSTREMASYLGISQPTVVRKMKKHGISRRSIHP